MKLCKYCKDYDDTWDIYCFCNECKDIILRGVKNDNNDINVKRK